MTEMTSHYCLFKLPTGHESLAAGADNCHLEHGFRYLHCTHTRYIFSWRPLFTWRRRSIRFCSSSSPHRVKMSRNSSKTKMGFICYNRFTNNQIHHLFLGPFSNQKFNFLFFFIYTCEVAQSDGFEFQLFVKYIRLIIIILFTLVLLLRKLQIF